MILNFVTGHLYNTKYIEYKEDRVGHKGMCKFFKVNHKWMYIKQTIPFVMAVEHVLTKTNHHQTLKWWMLIIIWPLNLSNPKSNDHNV